MKAILTPSVFKFLVLQGYRYCLSKTTAKAGIYAHTSITLTPTRQKPVDTYLALGYDTYFNIMHEPLKMARGVNDAEVLVNLDDKELTNYKDSISIV